MIVSETIGQVLASDTKTTIRSVDMALAHQSRMCADFADACLATEVAIMAAQPVIEALGKSMTGMIESRGHLAKATRELTRLQGQSNLKVTNFGCPRGFTPPPSGHMTENIISQVEKID